MEYFNPRPPCGGRLGGRAGGIQYITISIHAPRAGGDGEWCSFGEGCSYISIHAPRAGGDCVLTISANWRIYFNPRPPCGGRPGHKPGDKKGGYDFNPRPPCGGRRGTKKRENHAEDISIHAPRAGGDGTTARGWAMRSTFQSTPPVRGATIPIIISIWSIRPFQSTPPVRGATMRDWMWTALYEFQSTPPVRGATISGRRMLPLDFYFNPRPPCGGRHVKIIAEAHASEFQSTPPVRGATRSARSENALEPEISIHAPRAGGDEDVLQRAIISYAFQSTPPVRGATFVRSIGKSAGHYFNPRPPCGGRLRLRETFPPLPNFNPRPPCGGRLPRRRVRNGRCRGFQSTPPVRGATETSKGEPPRTRISIHAPRAGGDKYDRR